MNVYKNKEENNGKNINQLALYRSLFLYFKYTRSHHKRIESNDQISTWDMRDFVSKVTRKFHLNKK